MAEILLHGHHEGLLTLGRGYDERLEQIRRDKPAQELPLREARMRVLTAEEIAGLPAAYSAREKAYAAWKKAGAAREKADAAWAEAYSAWEKAHAALEKAYAAWKKACSAREKAYAALAKADAAREKAYAAWKKAYAALQRAPGLAEWHSRVCSPDCLATAANGWNIFGGG